MDFMRFKWLYFLISGLVLTPGIVSLIFFWLKPSIDFTGGTILEVEFTKPAVDQLNKQTIEQFLKERNFAVFSVQSLKEKNFVIKMEPISKDDLLAIKTALAKNFGEMPVEVRFETIGPTLGRELLLKTGMAVILAAGFILFYVAYSFRDKMYGICAILAMFHDTLVLLGVFSLLGHFFGVEIDTLFVTAMLTILSFSVHDTVVVYDRIRESQKHFPKANFGDLANKAVTETLSRSLNNSLTIIFMLIALWLLGGQTTRWFVFALLVGTISGTYSSTFTAVPLLVVFRQIKEKKIAGV